MNSQEFLNILQECLDGQIDQQEITDTLDYYKSYICEEEQKGKSKEEVIASLGNPRLIAHSILDAHEEAMTGTAEGYYDADNQTYEEETESVSHNLKPYLLKVVIFAIFIVLIVLGIFVLRILLPFILLAVVLGWIYNKFFNR